MTQLAKVGSIHTSVFTEAGNTYNVYHKTKVVRFNRKNIRLDSGGWFTATTKTRMNQASNQYALGFRVYQHAKKWYIDYKEDHAIKFYDGIMLDR